MTKNIVVAALAAFSTSAAAQYATQSGTGEVWKNPYGLCWHSAFWTPDQAIAALHELGTSPHYLGLYAAARDFRAPTASEIDQVDASFPRVARLNDLAETMVEIDEHSDHLKAAQKAGWAAPKDRPDIDPPHEALMLRELLREHGAKLA